MTKKNRDNLHTGRGEAFAHPSKCFAPTDDRPPLPEGWVWTTIGEVSDTTSGGTPSRKRPEYYANGTIPWIKSGELKDGFITQVEESITEEALKKSSAKIFPQGTPVVALYGATVGKTGILGLDAATNQAVCAIFALKEAFIAKYMTYWLQLQRPNLIEMSSGGAQPNISQGIVRAYPFPLAPLPEQQRIVEAIETQFTRLDAAVAALERAKANLARYKASVLKAACRGEAFAGVRECFAPTPTGDCEPADVLLARILDERRRRWMAGNPGKRYVEPQAPDTSNLPELPEGWCWATVEQLGDVIGGLTKNSKRIVLPLQLPYLRVANVYADELRLDDVQKIGVEEKELDRLLLKKGDLLIVEGNGSVDQIGRVAIWNGMVDPCVHQNHIIKIRLDLVEIGRFVLLWLLSLGGRDQIVRVASSTSGLYTLSISKVSVLPIPLPPLAEQQRIVAEVERRLSVVAEVEASIDANLARAARLRQTILKRAFEGRLV